MKNRTVKILVTSLLAGLNHSLAIFLCLYLILSVKFGFEERAVYALSVVLFWMGIQRLVKNLLPAD